MIGVDTNILVHAHRRDSAFHDVARGVVTALAEGAQRWAIPWPCVHEFFSKVTHPRVFARPSSASEAIDQVDAWLESPVVTAIGEGPDYWSRLKRLLGAGRIAGPMVHDARIAAICLQHGVTELLTADRDFGRFPALATRNPLIVSG